MKPHLQSIETLVSQLGGRGRFQLTIHLLAAYTYVPLTFNHVIMAFHGTSVPHLCSLGDQASAENISWRGRPVSNVSHSQCSSTFIYRDGQNETVGCSDGQWKYMPKYGEKNVVTEFDLVCSEDHLANLATTIYFIGVMVGGLLFGDLADRFGRLPIMLFTLYASVVVGVVTAFSVNYTMFVVLRFVTGILIQGLQTSGYTLIMELYEPQHRPFAGAITEIYFGTSVMILAGLAYGIRDWQYLQIAISLPGALAIFFPCVIPESLRWLIMKGKLEKAEGLITRICNTNKLAFPSEIWKKLKEEIRQEESVLKSHTDYNITNLFRTSTIRKRSIILFYLWLAISTSFYGLTFKMTSFKGSRYLIFFIGGAVETVAYALCLPVMNFLGRKKPLLGCFTLAALTCIAAGFIAQYTTGLSELVVTLALTGRCATATLFGVIFVYTSEIYPTVIRNIGMGACCFWARAGGVIAPQINQWTRTLDVDAIIIFGVVCLVAVFLVFPLPETHGQKLPDCLEEVEDKGDPSSPYSDIAPDSKEDGAEEKKKTEAGANDTTISYRF